MAKSNSRKTADVIHDIPVYFGPQADEPDDVMKKGDLWFQSDGTLRLNKSLAKRTEQLARVEKTLRQKTGKLSTRSKQAKTLRQKTGKLPTRSKQVKKLRRR